MNLMSTESVIQHTLQPQFKVYFLCDKFFLLVLISYYVSVKQSAARSFSSTI